MLEPLNNNVVIEENKEQEQYANGIVGSGDFYIPRPDIDGIDQGWRKKENAYCKGKVLVIGEGKRLPCDIVLPIDVKPNDNVIFAKHDGMEVTIGSKEYIIIDADSIYAII